MKKIVTAMGIMLSAFLFAGSANAAPCGRVSVAQMSWETADFLANLDKIILSEGYGCTVDLVPGDTMTTLPPMIEKQRPDIAPEAWIHALKVQLDGAVKEGRMHYTGKAYLENAVEGWYVPKYIVDANPEIKTIDDALKRPDLFASAEQGGKGAVYNCPLGWGCNISMRQLFKAYGGAEKGFALVEVGTLSGLGTSIAKAYERKQGWLGYYQMPGAWVAKYNLVKLGAVPHNAQAWDNCNTKIACTNPVKNDFPVAEVVSVVTDNFKKRAGPELDYIKKRGFSNKLLMDVLVFMDDKQANGEVAAKYFLKKYPEVWSKWVTPEAAAKIKAKY